jgi:hypothetical protein
MRIASILIGCALIVAGLGCQNNKDSAPMGGASSSANWAVTMDNIEACSCPTFCQCYFGDKPALHVDGGADSHAMRYCRFNNAFKITRGHSGNTSLDGMKFWMAGDLGSDFSKGQMDWCVLRFEPSASPEQRDAIKTIAAAIFPVKWNSFYVGADAKIDWQKTKDMAVAKLNDGKSAEIVLKTTRQQDNKPVIVQNAQFWAAHSTDVIVMTNEVEAYRDGEKSFEFKGTNGFVNTVSMSSSDTKGHAMASGSMRLLQAGAASECDSDCCK